MESRSNYLSMPLINHKLRALVLLLLAYCFTLIKTTQAHYKNQFNAQCFLNRAPSLSSLPTIRIYSSTTHDVDTQDCESNGVSFQLRAPDDWRDQRQAIKDELLASEKNELYNSNLATYVLIHGFMVDWKSSDWMCILKNQILSLGPANVFILDWSGGSKPLLPIDYGLSVSNTELVADILAVFLESLYDLTAPNNASALHLIGHSLGAHIAGFVGYSFSGSVGEIIALDPAGPCFTSRPNMDDRSSVSSGFLEAGKATRRLSRASAERVTALHTDATLLGLNENCADIDIYVNAGDHQPGSKDILDVTYSHSFAHDIISTYTRDSSDNLCYPVAYLCSSWFDFEAGQCGFCPDNNDNQCTLMGVKLSLTQANGKQAMQTRPTNLSHTDKMYIKLPAQRNSCFFCYQVVLSFGQEVGVGKTFYLEINQKDRQKRGDFFRISNSVDIDSDAHKRLVTEQSYWAKSNTSSNKLLPVARQFYTALLSFEAADDCRLNERNLNYNKSGCIPLDNLESWRVWAKDSFSQLAQLNSVTINYMSGRNHDERMKHSYMLLGKSKFGYVSRGASDALAPQAVTATTTTRKPLNVVRAFRSIAEKPIRCLTELQCPQEDPAKEFERFKYFLRSK